MAESDSNSVHSGKSGVEAETGAPQEWKKYKVYHVKIDPNQDDKSTEIRLCSNKRPHMRAFHCSWFGFFTAFFIWFAIAPLLSQIKKSLGLSSKQIFSSNVVALAGTIFMRFLLGPLCDKYGSRVLFTIILCLASIPTALIGTINTFAGLCLIRLAISIAGGTFVMCQYWTSRMFVKNIVGTANALAGGWGNLGGGVTQLVVGSVLFPLFKLIYGGGPDSEEEAWRTVCVVPAVMTFVTGMVIFFISDDAPKGNYTELKLHGNMPNVSAAASFRTGAVNFNTWILFFHYACTFGVELTMDNAAALYFHEKFGQSTESAAAIASIFGFMNLFSRALGGYVSDLANARFGMRGRLGVQATTLVIEGVLILVFARTDILGTSIAVMVIFSIFCQGGCGTTYGIVPYVNPASTGSISGIVGAGGNVGGVVFAMLFRSLSYGKTFTIMGIVVLVSSITTAFINIKGYGTLFCGQDEVPKNKESTIIVPEPEHTLKDKIDDA